MAMVIDTSALLALLFREPGAASMAADLDFGDCMTSATARLAGATLCFVGDDFARTTDLSAEG